MRERAAQELNPEMGRMGAEDPSTAFSAAPLSLYLAVLAELAAGVAVVTTGGAAIAAGPWLLK